MTVLLYGRRDRILDFSSMSEDVTTIERVETRVFVTSRLDDNKTGFERT